MPIRSGVAISADAKSSPPDQRFGHTGPLFAAVADARPDGVCVSTPLLFVNDDSTRLALQAKRLLRSLNGSQEVIDGARFVLWWIQAESNMNCLHAVAFEIACISVSDKIHNARAILADRAVVGDAVWDRFSEKRGEVLWYYRALANAFLAALPGPAANELARLVTAMEAGAA